MKIAIIRSCDRDDLKARLCYETMKFHNVADRYIFFHEDGNNHPLVAQTDEEIIYRGFSDNFGGSSHVRTMLDCMKCLPAFADEDIILYSDSDIIMDANPFEQLSGDWDHSGIYSTAFIGEIPHVSGQLNIIKGWLWNKYIAEGDAAIDRCIPILNENNYAHCDDTIFSVYAHLEKAKQVSLFQKGCWRHHKIADREEYEIEIKAI